MENRALGRSGVEVSRLILGCGNFGGIGSSPAWFGAGESECEAHALLDAAWAAGITTFDTADAYGGGRSETFIGNWLRSKGPGVREQLVLTTKTFNPMQEGADSGLSRERIRRQIEYSFGPVDRPSAYLRASVGDDRGSTMDYADEASIWKYTIWGATKLGGKGLMEVLEYPGTSLRQGPDGTLRLLSHAGETLAVMPPRLRPIPQVSVLSQAA